MSRNKLMSMHRWVFLGGLSAISVSAGMLGKAVYVGKTKAYPAGQILIALSLAV